MIKTKTSEQNKKALEFHKMASQKMQTLCADLFKTFGFNHLCYNRFSHGNRFAMFMTNHNFTERSIDVKIDQHFTYDLIGAEKNTLRSVVWDMNQQHPLYDWLIENNYAHGISFLIRGENDDLESWHLATDRNNTQINQVYLYHIEILKQFITHLKSQCPEIVCADSSLLFQLQDNRIFKHDSPLEVPFSKEAELLKQSISLQRFYFQIAEKSVSLTEKQFTVLKKYVLGYSSKEIAQQMGVTYRTVENSIEHIKLKLDCLTKSDLRSVYRKSIYGLENV